MGKKKLEVSVSSRRSPKERKLEFLLDVLSCKEGIRLEGKQDIRTKVMVTMFGLFAEIERELLSLRTKEALATAKALGKKLGRPKGKLGKSKLDGKEGEIKRLLVLTVSKASIAKIMGVDRSTLYHFVRSRKLDRRAGS